jgi:isoleucyl-tRNA synthetase
MFEAVNNRQSFPTLEEKVLNFWQDQKVFLKSVTNRKGGPRFNFYEGPPTANGRPGLHHVLARSFKDVIPRYRTMKGYYVPRMAGWDTHGLPVELEVEKQLGFTGKGDIEKFGIAKFNQLCRESVFKYLKDWNTLTERIGFWVDLEHPYVTMENNYIESVWWSIKRMWDKGLVYQGYRVTPHCPRCGTSLSSHEVALGYQDDTEDPSVYVKFKLDVDSLKGSEVREELAAIVRTQAKNAYLLAWTTTPWTLPGNTALAVLREAEYAVIKDGNDYLIMAEARRKLVLGENPDCRADNPVLMKIKGADLDGLRYVPLYNPAEYGVVAGLFNASGTVETVSTESLKNLTYPVIATGYVTMEEGTGVVHTAPAYGEDDYNSGIKYRLYFIHPVDLAGKITGNYPFAGKFVKSADPLIIENLKTQGNLFRAEKIKHTYPFCWRCGTPLLYYAKQSWYIRTTAKKDGLISGNDAISWYPDYIKKGRFGDWLQNNVDWAFSRERYWGTPLPVWRCDRCQEFDCIGGVEELKKKPGISGVREPLDLHRPFVDDINYLCVRCGGTMHRQTEVMDCWFDSGAMPFAQYHYPYEHKEEFQETLFPADFICEAIDQTRGWFYSLHAEAAMLFDGVAFKNVICLGHILDAKGEKMSKSRGNVVDPWTIINKYGADPLRWYCFTATPPGNVKRFSEDLVADVVRRFMLPLWNVYSFFVTYANIDKFVPRPERPIDSTSELDKWILSELNRLIKEVDQELEDYNPTTAGRQIEEFVDDLSNWYVRRSRRRFWKSENDTDKNSAYQTLYVCLVTLTKLMAPFMPFMAEEMYRNLVLTAFPDAPPSVHLTDFPVADNRLIDAELNLDTELAMKISSLGRAARAEAGLKVRQPLAGALIKVLNPREEQGVMRNAQSILDELNVKELKFTMDVSGLEPKDYALVVEGDYAVAVPKTFSPELAAEGMAREIVHRLQTLRRAANFDIAGYILTGYQGDEYVGNVIRQFAAYIRQETLSKELTPGVTADFKVNESFKLEGHTVTLGVKKLD